MGSITVSVCVWLLVEDVVCVFMVVVTGVIVVILVIVVGGLSSGDEVMLTSLPNKLFTIFMISFCGLVEFVCTSSSWSAVLRLTPLSWSTLTLSEPRIVLLGDVIVEVISPVLVVVGVLAGWG